MSRRNICFYSAAYRGGSGWFVYALAEALAETGSRVVLIAPESLPVEREPSSPNVHRHFLPRGATGQGGFFFKTYRALFRMASSFTSLARARLSCREFAITHIDWTIVVILQFLWIRLLGGKTTYIVHDAKPHAWSFPERWRRAEVMLLRWSYLLPNRVVTLTEKAMQEIRKDYERKGPMRTIPHGAFTTEELPPLQGKGNILVFGMLRRNKRILESIMAMDLLPDSTQVKLKIAGAPHAEDMSYWSACEGAIASSRKAVDVELGFVAEERVTEIIRESDALLLPYEEFNSQSGVAILGSLSGRLLITTDAGGIGELMEHGLKPVLIQSPVSAQTIAAAIAEFAAIPVEQKRADAAESKLRLSDYLSWTRIANEYWAFLENDRESMKATTSGTLQ